MSKRKKTPGWATTNVLWETKILVWDRMAKGDIDKQVGEWLEQQKSDKKDETLSLDRKTISLVRKELENLPEQSAKGLPLNIYEYWCSLKQTANPSRIGQPVNDIRFSVEPKLYLTTAILEVTNQSQIETFHGTVRIVINDNYSLETHRLHWDGYGAEARLGNGDVANVQIAQWEWKSQQMLAVHLIESASGNPNSFWPRLYKVQNGIIENPEPIYLEIVVKPLSSSKIEHRAYYSVELSTKKPMIFRKIDSIFKTRSAEHHVLARG